MTKLTPRFLVLSGDGINCEKETAAAIELAGGTSTVVHVNDLLENPEQLTSYQGIALPGGFSFGDELGSGQLLALKLSHGLGDAFRDFVARGNPIIGICNGFQVLCKMGLFPGVALAHNKSGKFIDRWVSLSQNEDSICKWTQNMSHRIELPVRHGEGRVVFEQKELFEQMEQAGQIVLRYQSDINGSYAQVAGVCDPTGLVFGLMPHPEAYMYKILRAPQQTSPYELGDGAYIFKSIITYLQEK